MLLQNQTSFRADSCNSYDTFLQTMSNGHVTACRLQGKSSFRCNSIKNDIFEFIAVANRFPATSIAFDPNDDIRLVLPVKSQAEVRFGKTTLEIGVDCDGYILPSDILVRKFHPNGYDGLIVRIHPCELKSKLSALCGTEFDAPIAFEQPAPSDRRFADCVRKPLLHAARELDNIPASFHPILLQEIKALTLTRLLLYVPHNFSKYLNEEQSAPSRSQMRLAEDYMAANWNKPLDVNGLATAVGVSARTILRYFRDIYGEAPRLRVQGMRLEHAREMLRMADEQTTVMEVALRCGYSSLGNFAASYRRRFGELPSETRKKN